MDRRLLEAQALLRQGQVQLAEILCRQAVDAEPALAPGWVMLGSIAAHRGDLAQAALLLERALSIDTASADVHFRLGILRSELGEWDAALAAFDAALKLRPALPAALNLRGVALKNLNRLEEALESYASALQLQPDFAEALNNRGVALRLLGRWGEAIEAASRAVALVPGSAVLHNNLGQVLHGAGRFEEALRSFERSLSLHGADAEALNNRGMALHELGRLDAAIESFRAALKIAPDDALTLMNLGVSLYEKYEFKEALQALDRALARAPGHLDVMLNRANVLVELDRFDEAMASLVQVREQRSRDVGLLMNIGNALRDQHRFDEALQAYDDALQVSPDDAGVHWNRALCLLTQSDYERGWPAYEWRFKADKLQNERREVGAARWTGAEDVRGKTVLLHAEQGLGDTLQMSRFAPLLEAMGARVVLEVQKPLVALLSTAQGTASVVANGTPVKADFHCPMLSLPLAFGVRRDSIPSPLALLSVQAELKARWQAVIREREGDGPNIGLVWAGNPGYAGDHRRSFTLEQFRAALPAGPRYWCLQKDVTAADEAWLQGDAPIRRFEENDFMHTAAQMASLDLVISVDTSLAQLAGMVAPRTWVLLPFTADFRWGTDTEATPWLPGAKLFRQERSGEWAPVLARVRAAVAAF